MNAPVDVLAVMVPLTVQYPCDYRAPFAELPGYVLVKRAPSWQAALVEIRKHSPGTGPEHLQINVNGEWRFVFEPSDAAKIIEARAAVVELIEADKVFDGATAVRIEADNRITSGDRSDDGFRRQASARHAYDRAVDRRVAALAGVGGAK